MNICFSWLKFSWENLSLEMVLFPTKIPVYREIRGFGVLVVFLTSGVLKWQVSKKYEPGKNIKICDITGIVPAATDHFPSNQKRP